MEVKNISLKQALTYLKRKDCIFVDLRSNAEYARGHLKGAVNIPYEQLEGEKRRLKGYRYIFVYCERGNQSLLASRDLSREGYPVINIWGGIHSGARVR